MTASRSRGSQPHTKKAVAKRRQAATNGRNLASGNGRVNGNRRRKLDALAIERAVGALLVGSSMEGAARAAGCSRNALYALMKRDESFTRRANDARAEANDFVEQNLINMSRTHPVAAIFYLKNRMPDDWHDRHEIHNTHEVVEYVAHIGEADDIAHEEIIH